MARVKPLLEPLHLGGERGSGVERRKTFGLEWSHGGEKYSLDSFPSQDSTLFQLPA
jgi:hypothetical protein